MTPRYALACAGLLLSAAQCRADATPAPNPIPVPVTELGQKVVDFGTHKITYIRITPPALPVLPIQPSPTPRAPTAEEKAAQEQREAKAYVSLSVTGVVYVGSPTVTELTWWGEDGQRFRAWSNADFRLLTQLIDLETATHVYAWHPFVSEGSVEEILQENRPAGLSLFTSSDTTPEYYFEGSGEDMAKASTTLAALDYLHAYYQIHREKLATDYAQRIAESEAQAAELAKNPPKPVNTTIHFWKMPAATSP